MSIAVAAENPASSPDRAIRVMLVDDAAVARSLLRRWIDAEPDMHVVAAFRTGRQAVDAIERHDADVVMLDVDMPELDGISALPLLLQKNRGLKFLCQMTELDVVAPETALTTGVAVGTRLRIPINHFEGNYTCSQETLATLKADDRIVFRYVNNPNGSMNDIAGICNEQRNVVGLMPHPERASSALLGSTDGALLLGSLLSVAGRTGSERLAVGA